MSFQLGKAGERDTQKALKSLIAHENKGLKDQKEKEEAKQLIYLIINTDKPLAKLNDHIARIIPIPHRMTKASENSILLITKDPSTPYRDPLLRKKSPTEDMFKDIMPLKKVRIIARSPKSLKKLFHEYDLIVADHRVHHLLPDILGEMFYKGHKKLPYMVQLARPDPTLSKIKKQDRVERCDPKYVKDQIKSICKNTSFVPNTDTSITVKIGYTSSNVEHLTENILSICEFLKNPRFQPIGGLLKHNNQIRGMFVKTNESASLPIYSKK